eukprot:5212006-Prymnesium_polylepis.2
MAKEPQTLAHRDIPVRPETRCLLAAARGRLISPQAHTRMQRSTYLRELRACAAGLLVAAGFGTSGFSLYAAHACTAPLT